MQYHDAFGFGRRFAGSGVPETSVVANRRMGNEKKDRKGRAFCPNRITRPEFDFNP